MEPVENIFKLCNHLQTREPTETDHLTATGEWVSNIADVSAVLKRVKTSWTKTSQRGQHQTPIEKINNIFQHEIVQFKIQNECLKLLNDYFQFCPIYCSSTVINKKGNLKLSSLSSHQPFVFNLVSATLIISTTKAAYFYFQ